MATLIDGKAQAVQLRQRLARQVRQLHATLGRAPSLAVILVGEDAASQVYVRRKGEQTREVGMQSHEFCLSADTSEAQLLSHIEALNHNDTIDGILVQLPLPRHIDSARVLQAIDPERDVDGFHPLNAGRLFSGLPALTPCTPLGCMLLLRSVHSDLSGRHAVVLGRSNIVGKPVAQLLLQADCTVTLAHSHTPSPAAVCRTADILISAVGRPGLIQADWVRPGATVIDVGINRIENEGRARLVGDVDFAAVEPIAGALTPVPGGVGPMTIACLLHNTLLACTRRKQVPWPEAD